MKRDDLLFPELSYKIIGCAFEVFNTLGGGHKEEVYHKALAVAFQQAGLQYLENLYSPLKFYGVTVSKKFFDFLVEGLLVVEIKSADRYSKAYFDQLSNYLVVSGYKLGLLICFGRTEVKHKRILNIDLLNKEKELKTLVPSKVSNNINKS